MNSLILSSPELLTTRAERASARKVVRDWEKQEKEKDHEERREVKQLLRDIDRPIDSTEDYRYREEKLNRLWTLAFS